MRREAWRWFGAAAAAALIALALGCEKPPPEATVRIMLADDELMAAVTDPPMPAPGETVRSWATAPWTGHDWIPYVGPIVLDIDHDLGRVPQGVLVYLSFTEEGLNPGLAAGDLAQILEVTEDRVVIWNNTNGAYFVRVVVF
ncbi:MAG: hypothetical protein M3Y87_03370 [Myxococcota bacterium]|nr:hypothetical protein [Myxococcota bacterium]